MKKVRDGEKTKSNALRAALFCIVNVGTMELYGSLHGVFFVS